MKKFLLLLLTAISSVALGGEPWRLTLQDKANGLRLCLDLYEESIEVPGMEMFGPMNGYMNGKGLYGVWSVTSYDIKNDREALVRMSNDLGSDTQEIEVKALTDSTYQVDLVKGVSMKKVVGGKKLQKIDSRYVMEVVN